MFFYSYLTKTVAHANTEGCAAQIRSNGFAALLIALPAADAWAGAFTVTPVRIYMTPRDRAVALTVINEGDAEKAKSTKSLL